MVNPSPVMLRQHQVQFLDAWLSEPGRNMALLWPAGSGVFRAIDALIKGLDPSQRVLIIADRNNEVQQFVFQLDAAGVTAQVVDRYTYRQLQSEAGAEMLNWRGSGVFALTTSLVSQPDVLPILKRLQWDLIVLLDTSKTVTAHLVEQVTAGTTRVLWNLRPGSDATSIDLDQWSLNKVSVSDLISARGLSSDEVRPIAIRTISVQASIPEEKVLASVNDIVKAARGTSGERLALCLRLRWMSSPAALESGLRQLEARLGTEWPLWSTAVEDADDECQNDAEFAPGGDLIAADKAVKSCLGELDHLDSDSKLRCLLDQLGALEASQPTAVFVRYRDTASYLHAALEDLGVRSMLIHGAMAASEIHLRLQEFFQQGGVLVMTNSMLPGADLRSIRNLILYDPPTSREVMAQLLARFHIIGMPPLNVSIVTDQHAASEAVRLIDEASHFFV